MRVRFGTALMAISMTIIGLVMISDLQLAAAGIGTPTPTVQLNLGYITMGRIDWAAFVIGVVAIACLLGQRRLIAFGLFWLVVAAMYGPLTWPLVQVGGYVLALGALALAFAPATFAKWLYEDGPIGFYQKAKAPDHVPVGDQEANREIHTP